MAIQPREEVQAEKPFTHRDHVLAAVAFAAAAGLNWAAGRWPDFAVVFQPLSLVLGGIGIVIILSMLQLKLKKKHKT